MQIPIFFTVVPFLPDRHKCPPRAHCKREGMGHMHFRVIDSSHPKPRSIATSTSRLFSYVECTENACDACVSTLCFGTFFQMLFSFFLLNATTNYAFLYWGEKNTMNNTYSCVALLCHNFFSSFFSAWEWRQKKWGTCLEIVSAIHLHCVSSFSVWTNCERMCLCSCICSILSAKICIQPAKCGHFYIV